MTDIPDDELETEARQAADRAGRRRRRRSSPARCVPRGGGRRLLVDAVVIGNDASRWQRRLDGHARELERQRDEVAGEEGPESGRVRALELTLEQLDHLRAVRAADHRRTRCAGQPRPRGASGSARFEALAPRVLRMPAYVRRVLADLRPMADVGPIDLDEARRVLTERLLTLESEPPSRRFGRVFVGTPQQARGRSFRVVFVPGPRRADVSRKSRARIRCCSTTCGRALDAALPTQHDRLAAERLLLQIAAGAARDRLYVSYPRIELSESRARVPSFYALDVMRAVTGRVPDHEWLEERARVAGSATLAWPAPPRPEDAHRRPGARPGGACAGCSTRRIGGGQGPRALSAQPERVPAPLGHRPLGARPDRGGRRATG